MSKENPTVKIIVACHKQAPEVRCDDIHMPVHVGHALNPVDLGYQPDDEGGDNISAKNPAYCELTAMYWAWKNLKEDVDYIGLAHYRRYFNLDVTPANLLKIFEKNDIIAIKPMILPQALQQCILRSVSPEDFYIMIDSLLELYPDYRQSVIEFFYMRNRLSLCNMFIAPCETFGRYCEFLFSVLQLTESRLRQNPFNRQRRVMGYLGEVLLGLWIGHNRIKPYYVSMVNAETGCLFSQHRSGLRTKIDNLRLQMSFIPVRPIHGRLSIPQDVYNGLKQDGVILKNLADA